MRSIISEELCDDAPGFLFDLDADLMIELTSSPLPEPRDRIPEMLRALSPLPCPIDPFVLTSREVEVHTQENTPLLREILAHGIDILDPSVMDG